MWDLSILWDRDSDQGWPHGAVRCDMGPRYSGEYHAHTGAEIECRAGAL